MSRKVAEEHRALEALFAESREAFEAGGMAEAQAAFERLREALESHFEQEDRLYYPAIWALRREHKSDLERFVRAHEGFRARFESIAERLTARSLAEARRGFEEFAQEFARHEVAEEELLRALEAHLAPLA